MPQSPLLRFFRGAWRLRRRIETLDGDPIGSVHGTARFKPVPGAPSQLLYAEELRLATGKTFPMTRHYLYCFAEDDADSAAVCVGPEPELGARTAHPRADAAIGPALDAAGEATCDVFFWSPSLPEQHLGFFHRLRFAPSAGQGMEGGAPEVETRVRAGGTTRRKVRSRSELRRTLVRGG